MPVEYIDSAIYLAHMDWRKISTKLDSHKGTAQMHTIQR